MMVKTKYIFRKISFNNVSNQKRETNQTDFKCNFILFEMCSTHVREQPNCMEFPYIESNILYYNGTKAN